MKYCSLEGLFLKDFPTSEAIFRNSESSSSSLFLLLIISRLICNPFNAVV